MKTKLFSRVLSLFLAIVTVIGVVPFQAFAQETTTAEANTDFNVESDTALGDALADLTQEELDEQENSDYSINWLEMEGNVATVYFSCIEECNLVVAVYTENEQMVASGNIGVTPEMSNSQVWIGTDEMPEYYIVKAFLLDSDNGALCDEFICLYYTRIYQEFFDLTTEDFDEEYVMQFDETTNKNNFVAVRADAQIAYPGENTNILVSVDEDNGTYVFKNPDEVITGLLPEDVFYYNTGDNNYVLITVSETEINGNKITVTADLEVTAESLFDCIKIEKTQDAENTTIDTTGIEEGVTLESQELVGGAQTFGLARISGDFERSVKTRFGFKLEKKFEKGAAELTIGGDIGVTVGAEVKCYYWIGIKKWKLDYNVDFTLKLPVTVDYEISLNAEVEFDKALPLGEINIPIIAGVIEIGGGISFVFSMNGKLSISGSYTRTNGFTYTKANGYNPINEKSGSLDPEASATVTVKAGIKFSLSLTAFKIIKVSLNAEAGFKATITAQAPLLTFEYGDPEYHECDFCIDGEIVLYVTLSVSLKIGYEGKIFSLVTTLFDKNFLDMSWPILDFYISYCDATDETEFGLGTCPYIRYRVNFNVLDTKGKAIEGAKVSGEWETGETDAKGNTFIYNHDGAQEFTVTHEDHLPRTLNAEFKEKEVSYSVFLEPIKADSISIYREPDKSDYYVGDTFDPTGMKLKVNYNDGTTEIVSSGYTYKKTTFTKAGETSVTINYENRSVKYYIDVKEVIPDTVEAVTVPTYYYGDSVGKSGLSLRLVYNNGKTKDISYSDCTLTPSVLNANGWQTVTAEYDGITGAFDVYVVPVTEIKAVNIPQYYVGDAAKTANLKVTAYFEDGTTATLTGNNSKLKVTPTTFTQVGQQTLTVEYLGKTVSFDVNVLPVLLEKIEVATLPDKMVYSPGEAFDPTGTVIREVYNNGKKVLVSEGYTYEASLTETGLNTVTFSHAGFTCEMSVLVSESQADYSGTCGNTAEWYLRSGTGEMFIVGCGTMTDYLFDTYKTAIPWYNYRESIKSVEIGSAISSVGDYSFRDCANLESVIIPEGIVTIGEEAFIGTSITEITLPASVTTIESNAFYATDLIDLYYNGDAAGWCNIKFDFIAAYSIPYENLYFNNVLVTDLVIPEGVTEIGCHFFGYSNLKSVEIPASVTSIERFAFYNCTNLVSVTIADNSELISIGNSAFKNCTNLECINIPEKVTSIGTYAFSHCSNLISVEIPAGLTSIEWGTFEGCSKLATVTFAEGSRLKVIDSRAFYDCLSLTETEIPASVTSIGANAFYGCSKLSSITFEEGSQLSEIGEKAFYNCYTLTGIEIPAGITAIGNNAFQNCSALSAVTFAENSQLSSIGKEAFKGCSLLAGIEFPASVTSIGTDAFYNCTRLKNVTFENGINLPNIDNFVFYGCSALTGIEIPASVTSIGTYVFRGCSKLASVTFENGSKLTGIGNYAFNNCSSLAQIEIPAGVTSIGTEAFRGCSKLVSVSFAQDSQLATLGDGAFYDCKALSAIKIPEGITSIGENMFYNCTALASAELHAGITDIGDYAFYYCKALTSMEIPAAVKSIGVYAFYNCTGLISINIPEGVETIGERTFCYCKNLRSIEIPSSVRSIDNYAFYNCVALENIVFVKGSMLSTISANAFYNCRTLTSLDIPAKVISIGDSAFRNCSGIKNVRFASNSRLKTIEDYGFAYCTALETVNIPNSTKSIGEHAFEGCTSLKKAEIPGDIENVGDGAFNDCPEVEVDYGGNEDEWEAVTGGSSGTDNSNVNYNDRELGSTVLTASASNAIVGQLYTLVVFEVDDEGYSLDNLVFIATQRAEATDITFSYIPKVSSGIEAVIIGEFASDEPESGDGSDDGSGESGEEGGESGTTPDTGTDTDTGTDNEETENEQVVNENTPGIPVESIELSDPTLSVVPRQRDVMLSATVLPADASFKGVLWTSSDKTVARVNDGYIIPLSEGTTVITAKTCDGGFTAECLVNVSKNEYKIEWVIDSSRTEIQNVTFGEKIVAPDSFAKKGHTFTGWTPAVQLRMPAHNLKYTAVWDVNSCNAVFEGNGGKWSDGTYYKTVSADYLSEIPAPDAPVRDGYVFAGWIYNGVLLGTEVGEMTDADGMTFIARWIEADKNYYSVKINTMNTNGVYIQNIMKYEAEPGTTVSYTPTVREGFSLNTGKSVLSGEVTEDNKLVLEVYFARKIYTLTTTVGETVTSTDYYYGSLLSVDEPERTGYVFTGWSDAIPSSMPAADIAFEALWMAETYRVFFDANGGKWADGSNADAVLVKYDAAIETPTAPEKEGEVFAGWMFNGKNYGTDAGIMKHARNITFTASWISEEEIYYTVKTYTMNTSGAYVCSTEVISASADEEITLSPEIEAGFAVNEEKSKLSGTVASDNSLVLEVYIDRNIYTLTTVVDEEVKTEEYYYGEEVTKPEDPDKTGYTFSHWSVGIPSTMPAENVTAQAVWNINVYTVTWDIDGELTSAEYNYGDVIEKPVIPEKEGYSFNGWGETVPDTMPAEDLYFTAQWGINSYTITWNIDSETVESAVFTYGESIEKLADPEKEGHTFKGWDSDIPDTMPAQNLEFTAQWEVNTYTVTWCIDGVVSTVEYKFGDPVESPETPEKEGYTFAGWGGKVPATMPANNLEFNAGWSLNEHTVTWSVDNTIYNTRVFYGSSVIPPLTPEKTGYTFKGWSPDIPDSMPDRVIGFTAIFTPNIYDASFDANGGIWSDGTGGIKTVSVAFNNNISVDDTPQKQGYVFAGWSANGTDVTPTGKMDDINGKAFIALWLPADDTVYTVETYRMNTSGEYELELSEKRRGTTENTAEYVYTEETGFTLNEESSVLSGVIAADASLVLKVYIDRNTYSLTTVVDDSSTETLYYYEATIAEIVSPEKEGHTFVGWDAQVPSAMPAENIVLTAKWDVNIYEIIWIADGEETTVEYAYNEAIEIPDEPQKTGYSFVGWSGNIPETMPAENLTFTAEWSVNSYPAFFSAEGGNWPDGSIEKTVLTAYGAEISAPDAPGKQGFVFAGWNYNGENIGSELGIMDSVNGKEFSAVWAPATDTPYTVETYIMNTEGEYDKTSETLKGTTGETVTTEFRDSEGFAFNAEKSVLSGIVAADGSLVLKVYADRNKYKLTTVADGVSAETEYFYGATLAEPTAPVKSGYKFIGWDKDIPVTMPAYDLTLVAEFEKLYICPDCGEEILGEDAINEHIAAEARKKATVKIKNNYGSKTINYGETLRLTAITASMPADAKIYWYVDGVKKGEDETFNLNFGSGTKTVEVKIVDANGNALRDSGGNEISDSEIVTVKAGFFQKLISFFKNLFGVNRTVVQTISCIF